MPIYRTLEDLLQALRIHIAAHPEYHYICDDDPSARTIGFSANNASLSRLDTWAMHVDLFQQDCRRLFIPDALTILGRQKLLENIIQDVRHSPPAPPRSLWERLEADDNLVT